MRFIFRLLLTINATSWGVIIYLVKSNIRICNIPIWVCGLLYLVIPVLLSAISLLMFRSLGSDSLKNCQDFSLADHEFLPVYLGYFFLSISINENITMIFVYSIVFIFTFLSQTQYFNPIFLLFGYHYYHILTPEGTRVFVISRGKVIRSKNQICFSKLKRINDTTYIDMERKEK